jgi:hypothetical protein
MNWFRVTKKTPCRICHKPDYCTFSELGDCCMRIASEFPLRNGGFLHKADTSASAIREKLMRPMPPPRVVIDPEAIMKRYTAGTADADRKAYATKLGVDPYAVEVLGAAYALERNAWAWPMRDGDGDICGIRLRSDDAKWAVTGSKAGLFIPQISNSQGIDALICEGPTDCAAALTLGYFAIGRPSCRGGADMVKDTCRRLGISRVVIVADHDEAKVKPTGERWYPGKEGAQALAAEIKMPSIVIMPNAKDLRAWVRGGATGEDVYCLIKSQKFVKR